MPNCKFCGRPVAVSPVWHSDCWGQQCMVAGERFCDEYCKYPDTYEGDEEKLHDEICSRCPVSELLKLGL